MRNAKDLIITAPLLAAVIYLTPSRAGAQSLSLQAAAAAPVIISQPEDQLEPEGSDVTFSVSATRGGLYQWQRNGVPMPGETNATLVIHNAQIEDAGYYSCVVSAKPALSALNALNSSVVVTGAADDATSALSSGLSAVSSEAGSLMVYAMNAELELVVYGAPILSGGYRGGCPGAYVGYVTYVKTSLLGWGWTPLSGATVLKAKDNNRENTRVEYVGCYGDMGCAKTTVTVPYPTFSAAYRFTIYFTNNVPTTNYPITLTGFNP